MISDLISDTGKKLTSIDIEPLAFGRALITNYPPENRDKTVCIVEIGHTTTSINIYSKGRLLMPRQVPVGGAMFTKAISESKGISMIEAEKLKKEKLNFLEDAPQESEMNQFYSDLSDPNQLPEQSEEQPAPSSSLITELPAETTEKPKEEEASSDEFQPYNPFGSTDDSASGSMQDFYASLTSSQPEQKEPETIEPEPQKTQIFTELTLPTDEPAPITQFVQPYNSPNQGSEPDSLASACQPILEEFASEIERSIEYIRSHDNEVDLIMLCGGGSQIKGLKEYFQKNLNINCDTYNPFNKIKLDLNEEEQKMVDEHSEEFTVAIGNALQVMY